MVTTVKKVSPTTFYRAPENFENKKDLISDLEHLELAIPIQRILYLSLKQHLR